jgi:hypothetical protein
MRRHFVPIRKTLTTCLVTTILLCGIAVSGARAAGGVTVNGVSITPEKVQSIQKQYGIRIVNGDYWYDKISGAWGYIGGPTVGQIYPYIDLGGPMKADVSNGNTGVFINGRELHVMDVRALQQITIVIPGRYWCDAMGNIGFEGGPALANLWALANAANSQGAGVKREGILSTYDKTGAVVIGP